MVFEKMGLPFYRRRRRGRGRRVRCGRRGRRGRRPVHNTNFLKNGFLNNLF